MPQPRTRTRRPLLALGIVIAAAMLGGCSEGKGNEEWGAGAIERFESLSVALNADDVYGILDFYAPHATVQSRTSDFQDALVPVSDYLASHRADLSQDPIATHLGESGAVVLVAWPESGRFGAISTMVEPNGAISREVVFLDLASLERGLLASPEVVDRYTEMYRNYAAAWSSAAADSPPMPYGSDVIVHNRLTGQELRARDAVESSSVQVQELNLASVGHEGASASEPALYLDPVSFGEDPNRAVGVYRFVANGCSLQMAVIWRLDDRGRIVSEERYPEVESFRSCNPGNGPEGWWTDLGPPVARDQLVTGVLETPGGQRIEVFNGTDRLMGFAEWGFGRFAAAGLTEPQLESVTFEPTRRCDGVGGRVTPGDDAHDLVLCIDEPDLCNRHTSCDSPPLAIRSAMLHEMGHVWLNDNTDAAARDRLLGISQRTAWSDPTVPWVQRGAEYAAEVIAWGLVDEPIELEQLGSPPCEELQEAFQTLTGRPQGLAASACRTG